MAITRRTLIWVLLTATSSFAILIATLLVSGHDVDGWLLCARYTARFSFLCFLLSFLASRWIPKFTQQDTRDAFLAFAAAHIIHFGALMTYLQVSNTAMNTGQLTFGFVAYMILVGLSIWLLTGKNFPRFHAPMVHYILFVFALTYSTRLPDEETRIVGILGVGTSLLALALRHIPQRKFA